MINFANIDEAFPNDDKLKNKKAKKDISEFTDMNEIKTTTLECAPLQAPIYEPPKCNNTTSYQKAIETSLNSFPEIVNKYPNDGIKAYDFDELDAYLKVNDIKTNNIDNSPEYRTTPFLADYLKTLRDNFNKPISKAQDKFINIEQFTNVDNGNIKVDINLYNLFLFMFLGIIIILLIHQINQLILLKKS